MGKTFDWKCPTCGKSWQLREGHGMNHALLELVAKEFPPEMRQEVIACAGEEKWPVFRFNFRSARCVPCGSMVSVPHIEFPKSGKSVTGNCTACGQTVTCETEDRVLCPNCGLTHLEKQIAGDWD